MGEAMIEEKFTIGTVPELRIAYYPDTDTLVLAATEHPGPYGESVGKNLVAFTNAEGDVEGVTLEHAAELLRPFLCPDPRPHQGGKDLGGTTG